MTHQHLDRETVLAKLFELKNRVETARFFAISKESLNRRLKEWGIETDFRPRASTTNETFQAGDLVIWEPKKARQGFFGHPLGKAPIECVIISGPSKDNVYYVKTLTPVLGVGKSRCSVIGHALRKAQSNEQNV